MALIKPVTGGITAGVIGLTGTAIFIKARRIATNLTSRVEETTGDGDTDVQYEANQLVNGAISFNGWYQGGQASGVVVRMKAGTTAAVTVTLATGRTLSGTILVRQAAIDWDKTAATVKLNVAGVFTGAITEA
jgi:hypothetical protein